MYPLEQSAGDGGGCDVDLRWEQRRCESAVGWGHLAGHLAGIMAGVMTVDVDAVGDSARSGSVSTEAVS